ncbi:DUF5329 domain-containing protein [Massilia yuzhufengensis]|uniref:Lysozyme inhibitor LprI N-terminal domain-containing protein n=1 Tax=Massilia yuzhufengensis TaxID=1164594 RepID=A0A1I1MSW7_9BURK|nr:DUF5329 domain-containing protein [Massilia yuzhufengensis]SFC85683.1 hypothetical protein SAMN05216204_11160 [Massilia yuzhufengensis]
MTLPRHYNALAAFLCAGFALGARAAPTPAPVRAEITSLLVKLHSSGCQFERNRSWHSAADARSHLLRKLDYIENREKAALASTEQFIDAAASKSSLSGRAYRVKCGTGGLVDSAEWLNRELRQLREPGARIRP